MIVSLGEGNVPIVRAGKNLQAWVGEDIELYIIMEGMTPTGSFKDFGGTIMMSLARASGIHNVCCASTGDTSAMAAAYSAAAGIQCAVILPEGKITPVQLAQPLVHGARVILLPGDFDVCMKVMQELVAKYGVYPANSLNPARIEGHQATVFLVTQYFSWECPDWIAVPVGNGSNCSSVGKGLRLLRRMGMEKTSRILGCQSEAANPLTRSWNSVKEQGKNEVMAPIDKWKSAYKPITVGETTATAARIGDPVSRNKVMREITHSKGAMQIASERDLNEAVAICGKDGYFVCPQTGIALAGVRNARREGWIHKGSRVVVVSTATGLKFTDSAAASLQNNIISAADCKTDTVAKILKVS
jgi:threonine synthase